MPRHYKKKRKSYRRRRFTKKSGSGLTKSFPLSKRFTFKTRYCDVSLGLDAGSGGIPVSHVFHLTSLFDPDFTGIGHQPIGFDQIMPMYDHYTVIGARARVSFTNTDTTHSQLCCLQLKDSVNLSTNITEIIENGMNRYTVLSKAGGSRDTATLTYNFSAKKFYGKSPMDGDKYQGTELASPLEGAFLHITVDPQTTSNVSSVKFTVLIEYIAILSEPKQLSQS